MPGRGPRHWVSPMRDARGEAQPLACGDVVILPSGRVQNIISVWRVNDFHSPEDAQRSADHRGDGLSLLSRSSWDQQGSLWRVQRAAPVRRGAAGEMSVSGREDYLCAVPCTLLQAGDAGTGTGGHALQRAADATTASMAGDPASSHRFETNEASASRRPRRRWAHWSRAPQPPIIGDGSINLPVGWQRLPTPSRGRGRRRATTPR